MTAETAAQDVAVINSVNGYPDCRIVAILTKIRCLDVIGRLSRRCAPIVTAETVVRHAAMIEDRCRPTDCVVTGLARISARHVIGRFADRRCAVVTGKTGSHNEIVIDSHGRDPGRISMTTLAVIG